MNEQLHISGGSRIWRLDTATRRRGRRGIAEAREAIRLARSRSDEDHHSAACHADLAPVADAA